jgi:hypothetical protein
MKRSHAEMSAGDGAPLPADGSAPPTTRPRTGVWRDELRRTPIAERFKRPVQQVVMDLIFTGGSYDARKCACSSKRVARTLRGLQADCCRVILGANVPPALALVPTKYRP